MKKYEIRTLKDILDCVTKNNVDGFLKDFERWLKLALQVTENKSPLGVLESGFTWNDDGDYGTLKSINIRVKIKK